MTAQRTPTGKEITFGEDEIIVSKTDERGIVTYANDVFLRIAGYTENEIIGKPHNLIRHPDMPKSVFKLLWDTIKSGKEIFAYVINLSKNGDHYWVLAHVTPSFDENGRIIAYHSNRRKPRPEAVAIVSGLYKAILEEESRQPTAKAAIDAGLALVTNVLKEKGISYDEFIFSI